MHDELEGVSSEVINLGANTNTTNICNSEGSMYYCDNIHMRSCMSSHTTPYKQILLLELQTRQMRHAKVIND